MDEQVRYEREFGKYKNLPQPRIVAVDNRVDLHPETLRMRAVGRYELVNPHPAPIAEFHIRVDSEAKIERLEFGGGKLIRND
ncbi:hypothetical protein AB4084_39125, partial [Lysobacter sp. 2RAB21]